MSKLNIVETLLIEDFFHLPPLSLTPVMHLELQISPQIPEKSETTLLGYSRAWEKLIHGKNRGAVPLSSDFLYQPTLFLVRPNVHTGPFVRQTFLSNLILSAINNCPTVLPGFESVIYHYGRKKGGKNVDGGSLF
jgi:hypothetical protein